MGRSRKNDARSTGREGKSEEKKGKY